MLRESVPDQEKDWVHLGSHTSGNGESDFVIDSLDTDEHCSFGYLSNVLKHISFFLKVFFLYSAEGYAKPEGKGLALSFKNFSFEEKIYKKKSDDLLPV